MAEMLSKPTTFALPVKSNEWAVPANAKVACVHMS